MLYKNTKVDVPIFQKRESLNIYKSKKECIFIIHSEKWQSGRMRQS